MRITSWRPHACAMETALLDQAVENAMRGPTSTTTTTAEGEEDDAAAGKLRTKKAQQEQQQLWWVETTGGCEWGLHKESAKQKKKSNRSIC